MNAADGISRLILQGANQGKHAKGNQREQTKETEKEISVLCVSSCQRFDWQGGLRQVAHVKATLKRRTKSEAELLDHATNGLLRALKRDMLNKEGRVDRERLRREGYSDRLLDRLERA